ncbi:hypothetical protein BDR07DRAFT_1403340 [Suillus spraguei]|nr:hypothetical protein BDR07DRAFT_1403340 [Suillus spraguei]
MSPSIDPVARNITIITTTLTALMVLEYIRFLSDEIRLVWPRFLKTTESKIYVVTRYAGLAGQSFNTWFAFRMVSGVPNSPFVCRSWLLYQAVTIQCLALSVELLLMMRVYKMYTKNKTICALLFIFGSVQSAASAVNTRLFMTGTSYFPTCVVISPHHSRIYIGGSITLNFVIILVTILWRFFRSTSSWSETPRTWLKLVARDGGCTTIAMILSFIFMFLCTTRVINTQMSGNAGRIVLHQEKFRKIQESQKGDVHDPSRWTETIEVDLDDIEPFDEPDACPTSPSSLEVESTRAFTSFDSTSDAGTRDISDEHLCEWEDELRTYNHAH